LEAARKNVTEHHSIICTYSGYHRESPLVCHCVGHQEVSPLFQIRWKRIVIDEGHNSANVNSGMVSLAKSLSVERRWIVTGTPTTNLLGLSFGKSSEAPVLDPDDDEYLSQLDSGSRSSTTSEAGDRDNDLLIARRWTSSDREDLRKLAAMMIHFLAVPHFAAQPQDFDTIVIDPLFAPSGPQPGSIQVLTQVMQMQMIRHRFVLCLVCFSHLLIGLIGSRMLKRRWCYRHLSSRSSFSIWIHTL
jgi:SNF2-related domain